MSLFLFESAWLGLTMSGISGKLSSVSWARALRAIVWKVTKLFFVLVTYAIIKNSPSTKDCLGLSLTRLVVNVMLLVSCISYYCINLGHFWIYLCNKPDITSSWFEQVYNKQLPVNVFYLRIETNAKIILSFLKL